MKTQTLLLIFAIAALNVFAQNYTPVDKESKIEFKIKNFGFNTGGSFSGLKGKIHFEPSNLPASTFDVTIDANSVNTDNNMRDNHLREDTYFDVKNYPVIHFVSEKITASNKSGVHYIFGKLTIKKTTKDISFPFTAKESGDGYVFDGEFKINRRDFDVGGSSTLSDNVTVTLHVITKKE
ncbi:MAG: YceI family protein [Bacteroidetes bacterium]|nr:YceI family protein [Bacteroidota bacterium]